MKPKKITSNTLLNPKIVHAIKNCIPQNDDTNQIVY